MSWWISVTYCNLSFPRMPSSSSSPPSSSSPSDERFYNEVRKFCKIFYHKVLISSYEWDITKSLLKVNSQSLNPVSHAISSRDSRQVLQEIWNDPLLSRLFIDISSIVWVIRWTWIELSLLLAASFWLNLLLLVLLSLLRLEALLQLFLLEVVVLFGFLLLLG